MNDFFQACVKVVQLQAEQHNASTSKVDRQHLRRMVSVTIRNLTDHPGFGISASKAAKELAAQHGVPIEKMTWANQKRWDAGRKLFAYEHFTTVKSMAVRVLADPSKTAKVLASTKIVWVTRAENEKLDELGYTYDREDASKCYEEAGISIV